MKKKISVLLTALVLILVTVVPAAAITWGEPDNGEHPHVGTMIFIQNGVGFYSCSGTMIAPRVMLTAGHCVAGWDPITEEMQTNDFTVVRFEENAWEGVEDFIDDEGNLDWFGWFAEDWLEVDLVIAHPQWADFATFPLTYDMGVVILEDPYYPPDGNGGWLFGELPDLGFLETLRGREKNDFTSVGYGRQGTLPPFSQNDYERYKGSVRLLEVTSMISGKGMASAKFSNNPGIGGGTCYGDSGGPTFYADTEIIVTVTSFGWAKNGNCVGNDFNYRMDTSDALDFLSDVLGIYGQ